MDAVPRSTARFFAVTDAAGLDGAWARSHAGPVVLLNHDPGCGGSLRAHREMERLAVEVVLVDVERFHRLGQAVAARTGVRHESPQVLVLRGGVAVWAADHRAITAEAVGEALRVFA